MPSLPRATRPRCACSLCGRRRRGADGRETCAATRTSGPTTRSLTSLEEPRRTLPVLPRYALLPTLSAGEPLTTLAHQYVLPDRATAYLGAVGSDALAEQLRAANAKEGLISAYQVVPEQPTGACAVVITGHDR